MKKNPNDIVMPMVRANRLPARRDFLGSAVIVATTGLFAGETLEAAGPGSGSDKPAGDKHREQQAYQIRVDAARRERDRPLTEHPTNGDEARYSSKFASYSKGLPHNALGEVEVPAWQSLIHALSTGDPEDFERIQISGSARLVNPQAGLAFDMQGPDSHALAMRAAPRFNSAEQAAEIAENYWMALARDVSFIDYESNPIIAAAAHDLNQFSDLRVPRLAGLVTPSLLFRGVGRGDAIGPYISQFFWKETPFGAETIDRRMRTGAPLADYMTTYPEWLAIQSGAPEGTASFDPIPRYIRNGRDLGEWVHRDVLFQAYFEALLVLFHIGAPGDPNNPYTVSKNQIGFGTLGDPFIASVLCAVATRALKAVWYQKWYVHRRLRPEVFAGRIHNHQTQKATYPIHHEVFTKSNVLEQLYKKSGSYLLPMGFPEGSPFHPSFGAGHATVAGACVTILKAFFDESFVIPDPVEVDSDGLRLHAYSGPPLTVGGELDKLASNVAIGRNIAGVHWRSDATESLKLGEEIAIRFLQEERGGLNERFDGFSLTRFDGTPVVV